MTKEAAEPPEQRSGGTGLAFGHLGELMCLSGSGCTTGHRQRDESATVALALSNTSSYSKVAKKSPHSCCVRNLIEKMDIAMVQARL